MYWQGRKWQLLIIIDPVFFTESHSNGVDVNRNYLISHKLQGSFVKLKFLDKI